MRSTERDTLLVKTEANEKDTQGFPWRALAESDLMLLKVWPIQFPDREGGEAERESFNFSRHF